MREGRRRIRYPADGVTRGPDPRLTARVAACRACDASSLAVRARPRRSACWRAGRWRERIPRVPRRASPPLAWAACAAATCAALSSLRLRGKTWKKELCSRVLLPWRGRNSYRSKGRARRGSVTRPADPPANPQSERVFEFCARLKLFKRLGSFFCNSKSFERSPPRTSCFQFFSEQTWNKTDELARQMLNVFVDPRQRRLDSEAPPRPILVPERGFPAGGEPSRRHHPLSGIARSDAIRTALLPLLGRDELLIPPIGAATVTIVIRRTVRRTMIFRGRTQRRSRSMG